MNTVQTRRLVAFTCVASVAILFGGFYKQDQGHLLPHKSVYIPTWANCYGAILSLAIVKGGDWLWKPAIFKDRTLCFVFRMSRDFDGAHEVLKWLAASSHILQIARFSTNYALTASGLHKMFPFYVSWVCILTPLLKHNLRFTISSYPNNLSSSALVTGLVIKSVTIVSVAI